MPGTQYPGQSGTVQSALYSSVYVYLNFTGLPEAGPYTPCY